MAPRLVDNVLVEDNHNTGFVNIEHVIYWLSS